MAKQNRVVLVTGAAGGIGVGDHERADRGRPQSRRSIATPPHLRGSKASDRHASDHVGCVVRGRVPEAVASAAARFGRLDAVINNAGIGPQSLRPDAESRTCRASRN